MTQDDWQDPSARALCVALDGRQIEDEDGETSSDRLVLLLNAADPPRRFTVPTGQVKWRAVLTTGHPDQTPKISARGAVTLGPRSLLLLHSS